MKRKWRQSFAAPSEALRRGHCPHAAQASAFFTTSYDRTKHAALQADCMRLISKQPWIVSISRKYNASQISRKHQSSSMSTLKRPFGDIGSTAPNGDVGYAKRTAGSRTSFSRRILNEEFDDDSVEYAAKEVAGSSDVVAADSSACWPRAVQLSPTCSLSGYEICCYGMVGFDLPLRIAGS